MIKTNMIYFVKIHALAANYLPSHIVEITMCLKKYDEISMINVRPDRKSRERACKQKNNTNNQIKRMFLNQIKILITFEVH